MSVKIELKLIMNCAFLCLAASYEVEFKATQDAELFAYGDRVWDHLLLMAPELKRICIQFEEI